MTLPDPRLPLITHPMAPSQEEVVAVVDRLRELVTLAVRGDRRAVSQSIPYDNASLIALVVELSWVAGGMVRASGRPTDRMLRKAYAQQEGRGWPMVSPIRRE